MLQSNAQCMVSYCIWMLASFTCVDEQMCIVYSLHMTPCRHTVQMVGRLIDCVPFLLPFVCCSSSDKPDCDLVFDSVSAAACAHGTCFFVTISQKESGDTL